LKKLKKKNFYKHRYKYIQLHADDIGRSKNINSTIFQSIDKGMVRGVSVIVGQKYSLEAIKKLKKRQIKTRLHLNLTEGLSSAKHKDQSDLVDQNGNFAMDFFALFFSPLKFGFHKLKKDINKEINAQIIIYKKALNLKKFSLDGHNHIHCIPWISSIMLKLGQKHKLQEIRIPREKFVISRKSNIFKFSFYINIIKFILLNILSISLVNKAKKQGIFCQKNFIGILDTGHMNSLTIKKGLEVYKDKNKQELVEILIHPGASKLKEKSIFTSDNQQSYYLKKERLDELNLSKDPKLHKIFIEYENSFSN